MLNRTIKMITMALETDPSVTAVERQRILAYIKNENFAIIVSQANGAPRLISRFEVAKRMGCSVRTVDKMAMDGILTKRILPQRIRSSGFLESEVSALISGGLGNGQTQ